MREQIAQGNIDESITVDRIVRIKALQEAQQEVGVTTSNEQPARIQAPPVAAPPA